MNIVHIAILAIGAFLLAGILWHVLSIFFDRRTITSAKEKLLFPETATLLQLLNDLKSTYTQQMHGERRYGVFRYNNRYEFIFSGKNIALFAYSPETQVKILIMQTATFYSKLASFEYLHIEEPYRTKAPQLIELLRKALNELEEEKHKLIDHIVKDLS